MKNTAAKLTAILLSLGVTAQAGEVVPGDIFAAINLRDIDAITRMLGDDKAKALSATLPGGITPLHYAAQLNDSEIVFRLLAAGANPNAQTSGNQTTPLHWAADKGSADALRFLLKDMAGVSLKT